jgi:hypothetical protein
MAAQRAAPQLSIQSDLALAYQVQYYTNLSQTDRE